jgi:thioesterase domain-containing protein
VEIESALLRLPGVRDAAAVRVKDNADDAYLVGYVVGPSQTAAAGIRDQLAKALPAYMVPTDIVMLTSLPLTISGKIDRNALPLLSKPRHADARAPTNEIERALALIWQEVLHLPEVGVDDDFFELSGTSLQAFLIFAWIAKRLGQDLPATTMLRAPTIARQAELLDRVADSGRSKLVPFRPGGQRVPLFVVHAAYGDVMFVRELLPHIKSDRPLYGLQPPPLDGTHIIHRTIDAIAADYLAEIRSVQPTGPYFFAGYSVGGWVAYEMAQKLLRQGESVAFLGIIDAIRHVRKRETVAPRVGRHIRALHKRPLTEKLSYFRKRGTKNLSYGLALVRLAASKHLPKGIAKRLCPPPPYDLRPDLYSAIYTRAARSYAPQPYSGSIAVFSARGHSESHKRFWEPLARGGVSVMEIPAGHIEMVWPPYSALLGEGFDACLERVAQ